MLRSMRSLVTLVAVDLRQVREEQKEANASESPGVAKKQFSVESPSVNRPSFAAALEKSFEKSGARRSGRDRRNAPVFQGGYQ